jgi:hypothetical protein
MSCDVVIYRIAMLQCNIGWVICKPWCPASPSLTGCAALPTESGGHCRRFGWLPRGNMAKLLLEKGADLKPRTMSGQTPLLSSLWHALYMVSHVDIR